MIRQTDKEAERQQIEQQNPESQLTPEPNQPDDQVPKSNKNEKKEGKGDKENSEDSNKKERQFVAEVALIEYKQIWKKYKEIGFYFNQQSRGTSTICIHTPRNQRKSKNFGYQKTVILASIKFKKVAFYSLKLPQKDPKMSQIARKTEIRPLFKKFGFLELSESLGGIFQIFKFGGSDLIALINSRGVCYLYKARNQHLFFLVKKEPKFKSMLQAFRVIESSQETSLEAKSHQEDNRAKKLKYEKKIFVRRKISLKYLALYKNGRLVVEDLCARSCKQVSFKIDNFMPLFFYPLKSPKIEHSDFIVFKASMKGSSEAKKGVSDAQNHQRGFDKLPQHLESIVIVGANSMVVMAIFCKKSFEFLPKSIRTITPAIVNIFGTYKVDGIQPLPSLHYHLKGIEKRVNLSHLFLANTPAGCFLVDTSFKATESQPNFRLLHKSMDHDDELMSFNDMKAITITETGVDYFERLENGENFRLKFILIFTYYGYSRFHLFEFDDFRAVVSGGMKSLELLRSPFTSHGWMQTDSIQFLRLDERTGAVLLAEGLENFVQVYDLRLGQGHRFC